MAGLNVTAEKKTQRSGSVGTRISSGYMSEEHIANLRGVQWSNLIEEMRRSDEIIGGLYTAIRTAILGGEYTFNPDDPENPESVEIAKELQWAFFEAPSKKFDELLEEFITILLHGHYIGEPIAGVAEYEGKKRWIFDTIAFFSPRTIERWKYDEADRLTAIYQQTYESDTPFSGWIDAKDLIYLSIEKDGVNFEGISPFRRAAGNYMRKKYMQKLKLAGIARSALGFPDMTYPDDWKEGSDEFQAMINFLQNATSSDGAFIVRPKSTELTMQKIPFEFEKLQTVIRDENTDMTYVVLADFLMLGRDGGGNRMLGDTKRNAFLQSMSYIIWKFIDVINFKLVPQYMNWNYGKYERGRCAKLDVTGVEQKGLESWARVIKLFTDAGIVKPDITLEKQIRNALSLTPPPIEETPKPADNKPADEEPIDDKGNNDKNDKLSDTPVMPWRDKTRYEIKCNFEEIERSLTFGVEDFNYEQKKLLSKAAEDYIYELRKRTVKDGGNVYNVVNDIVTPGKAQFEKAMTELIKQAVISGQIQIEKELAIKSEFADAPKLPAGVYAWVKAQAKKVADDKMGDIEKIVGGAAISQASFYPVNKKLSNAAINEVLNAARERADEWIGNVRNLSGASVIPFAVNVGRRQAAEDTEGINEVIGFQYSAILDDRTTEICTQLDGQTRAVDDYESAKLDPPNHFNCRSILIPITKAEGEPQGGFTGFKISGDNARSQQNFTEVIIK